MIEFPCLIGRIEMGGKVDQAMSQIYRFPCLIGRIEIVRPVSSGTPFLVVSMPHR